jgi:hypothetical protein
LYGDCCAELKMKMPATIRTVKATSEVARIIRKRLNLRILCLKKTGFAEI